MCLIPEWMRDRADGDQLKCGWMERKKLKIKEQARVTVHERPKKRSLVNGL